MITKGIFGAPLKSASLCGSCNSFGLTVPDPVYRCFEEIMKRGLLIEGIFRLSGAAPEVENLLLDFDKPPTYGKYIDLKDYDIHAITGVVKKYLRQLPDPVIPIACHEEFIQLYDRSFSKKSTINSLALKIQQLPREHFHLIHYIIIMSSLIQKHSNINMMNPEALAVVLAPVCTGLEHNLKEIPSWVKRHTRTKMMNDMGQFIETNTKWTQIWTLLIEYSDTLLELWKDSSLLWQVVVSPPGRNTVPCHPSSSSSYLNEHNNASSPPLHPSRHSTNLSPIQQTELLLDIVPPYNKPQRRPSHHSHKSSDELYKVVIMRTRQNTTCKSLKNTIKRSSALLDSSSYHQYYAAPTTLVHSNSTSTSRISSSTRTSAIVHPSNTSLFSSKSSVTTASD
ncbi:hypothetical protein INT48_006523 [Thamnidium elegans]|uniref:Rho-GAP domain-containing protein n=1 Tax=Thamnidium elegans TaxID=101142 RepID=A0A8H7STV9_9FUNG|nr:hypothetical protein INT48_006523 [Thamnidium elegans]